MHQITSMTIVDTTQQVIDQHGCVKLCKLGPLDDFIKQLSSLVHIRHNVKVVLVFVKFVHSQYIGMIQILDNFEFVHDGLVGVLFHVVLLHHFNGPFGAGLFVLSHVDVPETARPEQVANGIVLQQLVDAFGDKLGGREFNGGGFLELRRRVHGRHGGVVVRVVVVGAGGAAGTHGPMRGHDKGGGGK